jgi:MFS family permease
MTGGAAPAGRPEGGIVAASWAVLLSSADTYVVVLVLPAMMVTFGTSLTELQRATPLVSGYLLGYIVALPLIGRISDRVGRRPLLLFSLATFCAGSAVTASSAALVPAVAGRAVQGLGGGALLPLTFALAADRWGPFARALPIGALSAVQELGALAGPVYGAGVVSLSSWQTVFWLNCLLALISFVALARPGRRRAGLGWWSAASAVVASSAALVVWQPAFTSDSASLVPFGVIFVVAEGMVARLRRPRGERAAAAVLLAGAACALLQAMSPRSLLGSPWTAALFAASAGGLSPLLWCAVGLAGAAGLTLLAVGGREGAGTSLRAMRGVDYVGAALAAGALTTVVLFFSSSGTAGAVLPPGTGIVAAGIAVVVGAFVLLERRVANPLVPFYAFARANAWGSLLASFALGAALIVVLVDVPLFARATTEPASQLGAALVLARFLAGVPVGALAGGLLTRALGYRVPAATGASVCAAMLALMSSWGPNGLSERFLGLPAPRASDFVLVACGVGIGATIAPLTTSLLDSTPAYLYGLAGSLAVVARMVGMVIGVSLLTTIGLHTFSVRAARIPSPATLCPGHPLSCTRYNRLVTAALTSELDAMFLSAALACVFAAVVVLGTQGRRAGAGEQAGASATERGPSRRNAAQSAPNLARSSPHGES